MMRLRDAMTKEVVELAPSTKCMLIDGLAYMDTGKVRTIGAMTPLQELRAFEMVSIDTGFDDEQQPRIMTILPKRSNGVAAYIASIALMLLAVGCGGSGLHHYHYSYDCYGTGCEEQVPQAMHSNPYARELVQRELLRQTYLMAVDRALAAQVHHDARVEERNFEQEVQRDIQRRAAEPRVREP